MVKRQYIAEEIVTVLQQMAIKNANGYSVNWTARLRFDFHIFGRAGALLSQNLNSDILMMEPAQN